MKYITICLILALSAVHALAEPPSKAVLMRELTQVYGMDQMISEAKKAAGEQARTAVDQMFTQVKNGMPGMGAEVLQKMQAAAQKLMASVEKSWTTEEAMQIWQAEFSSDMSVEELSKILEASKTPLGQKQIAASKRANKAFQQYLIQRSKGTIEKALNDYVADIQAIVAGDTK
jgi:hypothetical protein